MFLKFWSKHLGFIFLLTESLDSFANDTAGAGRLVTKLIHRATQSLNSSKDLSKHLKDLQSTTTIYLGATAGMRLLRSGGLGEGGRRGGRERGRRREGREEEGGREGEGGWEGGREGGREGREGRGVSWICVVVW